MEGGGACEVVTLRTGEGGRKSFSHSKGGTQNVVG